MKATKSSPQSQRGQEEDTHSLTPESCKLSSHHQPHSSMKHAYGPGDGHDETASSVPAAKAHPLEVTVF